MRAEKILIYTQNLQWDLKHGLEVTAVHQIIEYERGTPFAWFPEEVAKLDAWLIKVLLGRF